MSLLFSRTLTPHLRLLLLAGLILCAQVATAQKQDSITHHYDSLAKVKLRELDSSDNRMNKKIDSVQQRINSILNPNLSIDRLWAKRRKKNLAVPDSVHAIHELDSMKQGMTHKIDSLKALNLPTERYTRKLDSLNKIGPQKYIAMMNSKVQSAENTVQSVENKITKPINDVENKVNDKLNLMRNEGGTNANLPGNLNVKEPSLPGANLDTKLNTDLNLKTDVNNPLGSVNTSNPLGKIENPVSDLKNLPQKEINKLESIEQVSAVKDKLGDANKITDKLQSYEGDIKNIKSGNLDEVKSIPNALEKKAASLDELKDLQKETGQIDQMKGMIDKGNDPEAMKKMAEQQIKKQAVDHFKGQEQVLKQAMDQVSKLKLKYSSVTSLQDIPKRRPNEMKGKPFIERVVPGVTFQFQKLHYYTVDVNPVVSYRFSGHINGGFGWNERLSFNKWNKLSRRDRIYGPRVFGSYMIKNGFAVKAEVEKMYAIIPPSMLVPDGERMWVWSAFVGFKKDYKFAGKIKGNVQMLYNLYKDHYNRPYADRFNVRMGFEFPTKKKKKTPK